MDGRAESKKEAAFLFFMLTVEPSGHSLWGSLWRLCNETLYLLLDTVLWGCLWSLCNRTVPPSGQFCAEVCGVFAMRLYTSFGDTVCEEVLEFAMRLQLSQNCELNIDILLLVGQVVNHLFYWMSSPGMTKLTWRSWKSVCAQCLCQDSSGEHVRIILS
jgi:hypothetical protein